MLPTNPLYPLGFMPQHWPQQQYSRPLGQHHQSGMMMMQEDPEAKKRSAELKDALRHVLESRARGSHRDSQDDSGNESGAFHSDGSSPSPAGTRSNSFSSGYKSPLTLPHHPRTSNDPKLLPQISTHHQISNPSPYSQFSVANILGHTTTPKPLQPQVPVPLPPFGSLLDPISQFHNHHQSAAQPDFRQLQLDSLYGHFQPQSITANNGQQLNPAQPDQVVTSRENHAFHRVQNDGPGRVGVWEVRQKGPDSPAGSGTSHSISPSVPSSSSSYNPICTVCEDKASGYHYGVVSCEGCKGFFRRTVQKRMEYQCHKDGGCRVNRITRNRCQACRYNKCIEAGMSKESVRQDGNRKRKFRDSKEQDELEATARTQKNITQIMAAYIEAIGPEVSPRHADLDPHQLSSAEATATSYTPFEPE